MTWQEITLTEYLNLKACNDLQVGATHSDPAGDHGSPHMLTTWLVAEAPFLRHQCWPVVDPIGFSRPCLLERWSDEPSPSDVADDDRRAEHAEDAARDTQHERSKR